MILMKNQRSSRASTTSGSRRRPRRCTAKTVRGERGKAESGRVSTMYDGESCVLCACGKLTNYGVYRSRPSGLSSAESHDLFCAGSPCMMCTGAILLYRIPRVVIGEHDNFSVARTCLALAMLKSLSSTMENARS